jgi:hypothetical protein
MKIHLLVGQRKESYAGEFAPEVLEAIDEFGNCENAGEWLQGKMKEYRVDASFEALVIVTLEVPTLKILERLRPNNEPIVAEVVDTDLLTLYLKDSDGIWKSHSYETLSDLAGEFAKRNIKIGNDVKIGNFVKIGNDVTIGNRVAIGNDVMIGNRVTIIDNTCIPPELIIQKRLS